MFKKLYRHIYLSVMLTVAVLVAIIIVLSAVIIGNMMTESHENSAAQKLSRNVSSGRNYINSVMLSAANLAAEAEVVAELQASANMPLTQILDNACNYALKINAITIYTTDGRTYTSSTIAQIPSLAELQANERLNDFFTLEGDEYVSMRTDAIAKFYNNAAYDAEFGIISCCRKILAADGAILGFVFCDIFPFELYKFFDPDDESADDGLAMLRFDDGYFPYNGNDKYLADFLQASNEKTKSADNKYLIIPNTRNFFGGFVEVAEPLAPLYQQILFFILLLLAVGLGIMAVLHFVMRAVAGNVVKKLTRLIGRMEQEGQDLAL